jgi:ketosteroid isomerase-like protein
MLIEQATREDVIRKYFNAFNNKDIDTLETMFHKDVTLKDWEVKAEGLLPVCRANEQIFNSVLRITCIPEEIIIDGDLVVAVLTIEVITEGTMAHNNFAENHETLKVVDIFELTKDLKIKSISAYKQ